MRYFKREVIIIYMVSKEWWLKIYINFFKLMFVNTWIDRYLVLIWDVIKYKLI